MVLPVKNVLLIGAGGNLGPSILKEFLASSFNVTVLSRPDSKSTFPAQVAVVKSDYSPESLKAAFTNQDAVIALVGNAAYAAQKTIIDAAIAAGVKRFIPSEFGSNTASDAVLEVAPVLAPKRQVAEYLQSREDVISWTGLVNGPFLDWGVKVGFLGFNIAERKATLWDGGAARFAATNLRTVGKALVALLGDANYERTKNRYVYVASHGSVTQKDVLASLERMTGAQWEVSMVDAEERAKVAKAKFARGDRSGAGDLLLAVGYGKEELGRFEKLWNDELGLPEEDLDESMRAVVEGRAPLTVADV